MTWLALAYRIITIKFFNSLSEKIQEKIKESLEFKELLNPNNQELDVEETFWQSKCRCR